ncbi:ejaculatory bulb-specific protein 3-like [Chelonus insularis]|uniref:ejaculatory bulb-specific protein 3-like n=1 Tax=Chelonus insularis TaxID=460826 RepID=UPI00158CA602|nr:ejaculatory bulb-specific protein 3-like [Chelonus insularis]
MFHVKVLLVLILSIIVIYASEEVKYSDKYDYINVDEILNNPKQREIYYKCFLGTGPCRTPDARFFKERFPEAIVTNCRKCTKKQSESFDKITLWYTTHELDKYNAIVAAALKKYTNKSKQ